MFKFSKTEIPGVILIAPETIVDSRGYFLETYRSSVFKNNGISVDFVQENQSRSRKSVLRGLHFQAGHASQAKLVRCLAGEIFDVAVDLRPDSPTFLKWVGVTLSDKNRNQLFIPENFAHGFCTLSDEAEIAYGCSTEYDPAAERGIIWNDRNIGINWPLANPILSARDGNFPPVSAYFPELTNPRGI